MFESFDSDIERKKKIYIFRYGLFFETKTTIKDNKNINISLNRIKIVTRIKITRNGQDPLEHLC